MMELGRRVCLYGETTTGQDRHTRYHIDLVFYNVILKCYVLIDLKLGTITHQDVGQMDMYVRMYDE